MYSFNRTRRLLNKHDFNAVFEQSNKIVTQEFIIFYKKNELGFPRLGMALSKKVIPKAFQRNRIKRLLRESFRTHSLPAMDVVFLARNGVGQCENKLVTAGLGLTWVKLAKRYEN